MAQLKGGSTVGGSPIVTQASVSPSALANTIAQRDANGNLYTAYVNCSRGNDTYDAASYVFDMGDGWLRKKTLADARAELVTTPFGLGGIAIDISSTDLNTYRSTGFFRGNNVTNAPSTGWWYFLIIAHDSSSWVYQQAISYGSGNTHNIVFTRTQDNGTWSSWEQLLNWNTYYNNFIITEHLDDSQPLNTTTTITGSNITNITQKRADNSTYKTIDYSNFDINNKPQTVVVKWYNGSSSTIKTNTYTNTYDANGNLSTSTVVRS